jgi:hypothetical protein
VEFVDGNQDAFFAQEENERDMTRQNHGEDKPDNIGVQTCLLTGHIPQHVILNG